MNYNEFINSIKESRENKWFDLSERHHIIPRCLGGSDDEDNLIYLTLKEHWIAHKLLCEEYPDNYDLAYAFMYMSADKRHECTPEDYEYARLRVVGQEMPLEIREKISIALKNYEKTPEHCRHISENRKGKCLGDDNIMRTSEHRLRQSKIYDSLPDDHPMKKHSGEDSPLYGCHYTWMTNGLNNRRASDDYQISELESQGYCRGFTQKINTSDEYARRRREGRTKAIYKRICKICSKEFEAKSGNARYCKECQ